MGLPLLLVSLAFSELELPGPHGECRVLVVTPTEHVRVGAARLAELRAGEVMGRLDAQLLAEAKARAGQAAIVVFRARDDDGLGSWGFGDDLDPADELEVAALMLRSHLVVYRELRVSGYAIIVHTELGEREVRAMRAAVDEHLEELRHRPLFDDAERERNENDRWILRHLVFHFEIGFGRLVESVLPDKIAMLERRATLRPAR